MIQTSNLRFSYDQVKNYHFQDVHIEQGTTLFIEGPSGSGKTTFLQLLAGVLTPTNGEVTLANTNITNLSLSKRDFFRRDHIGYVFQQFNLVPYLSVLDNILLPTLLSDTKKKNTNPNAQTLIQLLQIDDVANHKATQLSQGQKQRTAIARALIGNPQIILADEPTSSLDQENTDICIRTLLDQCRENQTTLILISHDRSLSTHFDQQISTSDLVQAS